MTAAHLFVRRDVWKLANDDHTLKWYAKAVAIMQARDARDPTSWIFQANIHGSTAHPLSSRRFNQCKHGSWNFLAWHRLYLYYFERIVRAAVIEAGGPHTWALPYWNYDGDGNAAKLPRAFREPADDTNPLYVLQRRNTYNAGVALRPEFTSAKAAMRAPAFTSPFGTTSFGGGRADDLLMMASEPGLLEMAPHNVIHSRIGGNLGWMNDLDLAARDPIFWLHHANIDRLWTRWIALGHGRANPTGKWLKRKFRYYDENGDLVHGVAAQALDTEMLNYRYGNQPRASAMAPAAAARTPELVGSSRSKVRLTGGPSSVEVTVDAPSQARLAARLDAGESPRIYLNLDDVRADSSPGTVYGVYVNVPAGAEPDEAHFAGTASFFGITRGGSAKQDDRAHGYRLTYDITDLAAALTAIGQWDERSVQVSFHPLEEDLPANLQAAVESVDHAPVTVGRVSIFHA